MNTNTANLPRCAAPLHVDLEHGPFLRLSSDAGRD
jgi:hypothetical protein